MFVLTCFVCKKVLLQTEGMGSDFTVCEACKREREANRNVKEGGK